MGKYDSIIADAKVILTDVNLKAVNNVNSGLTFEKHVSELNRCIAFLEKDRKVSFMSRLKDVMFETTDDRKYEETAQRVANLTYQLNHCLNCKCITCAKIDERCTCEGCLYGSHVVKCDGAEGNELRAIERGVFIVDGLPAIQAKYNRASKETIITLIDRNEMTENFLFDLHSGKKYKL